MYSIVFGIALLLTMMFSYNILGQIVNKAKADIFDVIISILMIISWSIYHYMSH